MIHLETKRLIMRPITMDDIKDLYELNLDPDVIKYTSGPPFKSLEHTREFYANSGQYEKYKMGRFSTFLKSDNTFIGWCGLKYHKGAVIDLGYRFIKKYWGQGYATESSKASLKYGFEELDVKKITAVAMKANPASISVFQKIGMIYTKDIDLDGHEGVYYEIGHQRYQANKKHT